MLLLKEAGVPITTQDLMEAATVQNKDKIIENARKQEEQQMQAQQAQAQSAMQEQQARTELAQARAEADRGLGMERISRINENQALAEERRAQGEKDNEIALLNFVKALKEIESVDLAHLEKLLALSSALKADQKQENVKDEIKEVTSMQKAEQPQPEMNQNPAQNVSVPGS